MTRERGRDLAALGLLAVAALLFFWRAALLEGTFCVQDAMVQNYPFHEFFARALRGFSLPLWCARINCGFPLFAEGQAGVLYPFNLMSSWLLPTYAALNYNIVFHFWWAAAGTYAFVRSLGALRAAALTGALCYAFSGFLVVRAMSFNYIDVCAWMPFLFLLVEGALARGRWLYLWGAALVAALQFLAGHPQATAYALGAAALYGLYRGWERRSARRLVALAVLGVPLIGAGVAAVQLLPTAELVRHSARSGGVSLAQFVNMSLPPERLITLLLPNFFGNAATGSYWGGEAGFFIQLCAYVGIVPLLLSLAAVRYRRDAPALFFLALCGLALLLALGRYTALFEVLYAVPGLSFFRIPTRFLLWLSFGVAVLCGLGLDQILRHPRQGRRRRWWWLCLALALAAAGMSWLNREALQAGGGARLQYGRELRGDLWRCMLMLGGGGALLALRGRGLRRRAISLAAPLLVYGDLYSFGRDFNALIEPEVYTRPPETARFIRAAAGTRDPAPPRILSLVSEKNTPYDWHSRWALDLSSYRKYPATLRMYTGSLYGLANVLPGWSPLHLRRQWEFAHAYPGLASLSGVEYVLSYRPLSRPALELARAGEVKVYRNRAALPRAFVVPQALVVPRAGERLRLLRSRRFEPRTQVVLETAVPSPAQQGAAAGEARIVSYRDEEVQIELGPHHGGFLVLSDTYYPGWKAFVDGRERPVLRADHLFRAVAVRPLARRVVFRYQPASFRLGAWISLGFLLLVVGLGLWSRRWSWAPGEPRSVSPRLKAWVVQGVLVFVIHAAVTQGAPWAQMLQRSRIPALWGGP